MIAKRYRQCCLGALGIMALAYAWESTGGYGPGVAASPQAAEKKPMTDRRLKLQLSLEQSQVQPGDSIRGEMRLTNLTQEAMTFESYGSIRMYVDFTIKDDRGNVVSTPGRYGPMYATTPDRKVAETIPAGKAFVGNVLPSATLSRAPLAPGEYTVQAHFTYGRNKVDSEAVRIIVLDPKKN